ncbi:Mut7-C RNAse domain-containing protein [Natronomonas sp. EA1]|uniref:Mut7-C RNAse domain-containing protein n=1 Tax=Natronomonas sp. EA1 TaxID=3421655 RepID=UPI003EBB4E86
MSFLLDAMCGKLAVYLRMCGYDAAYALDRGIEDDDRLLAWARGEGRTLVTRDRQLAARAEDAILLTEREVDGQLAELQAAGIQLVLADEPGRCGACNGPVERVAPEDRTPDYAPSPEETAVWRCTDCGQHFWKGSHWDRVRNVVESVE